MAALDWIFAAVLLASMLIGAWRGLVFEVLSVLGWVAAFFAAQWFAADMAALLPRRLANLFVQSFDLDVAEPDADFRELEIHSLWHREHGTHAAIAWFRGLLAEVAASL